MGIRVQCPACHSALMAAEQMAGQAVNCPKCGTPVGIPLPTQGAAGQPNPAGPAPFAGPSAFPQSGQPGTPFSQPNFGAWPAAAGASKASSQRTLMIVALAGGGALVVLLICLAIWLFMRPSGAQLAQTEASGAGAGAGAGAAASAEPEHDFAYLPDNCALIAKLRMQPLLASPLWKELEGQFASMVPASELQNMKECETLVIGVTPAGAPGQPDDTVFIVRAAAGKAIPFNPGQLPGKSGEEVVNGKQLHLHRSGAQMHASCLLSPRTLLGGTVNAVRGVLQRGPSPNAPSRLQAVLKETDFSQPIALCALPSAWPAVAPAGGMAFPIQPQQILSAVVHATVGADLVLTGKITCSDANTANGLKGFVDLAKMAAGGNKVPPQAAAAVQMFQSLRLEVSGSVVNANLIVPGKVLIDAIRQQSQPPPAPFGVKKFGG